jgi:hypothetical protein
MNRCCDAAINVHVERFSFTIAYIKSDIAGRRVGENYSQLFSWHLPGYDELIMPIVTSIVYTTIL